MVSSILDAVLVKFHHFDQKPDTVKKMMNIVMPIQSFSVYPMVVRLWKHKQNIMVSGVYMVKENPEKPKFSN